MRIRACLGFLAMVCVAAPAWADSDGYYCLGPGYLAYELQTSMGVAEHELRLMRVGTGIADSITVPLPPFQVHGMHCTEHRVLISGFDRHYAVDLARTPPRLDETGARASSEAARNLGHWSQAGVVDIEASDPDHRYHLVITKADRRIGGASGGVIEHVTTTAIWQRTRDTDRIVAIRPIFHGIFEETID